MIISNLINSVDNVYVLIIMQLIYAVMFHFVRANILKKGGQKGYFTLIPIVSDVKLFKLAGMSPFLTIVSFLPYIIFAITLVIPIVYTNRLLVNCIIGIPIILTCIVDIIREGKIVNKLFNTKKLVGVLVYLFPVITWVVLFIRNTEDFKGNMKKRFKKLTKVNKFKATTLCLIGIFCCTNIFPAVSVYAIGELSEGDPNCKHENAYYSFNQPLPCTATSKLDMEYKMCPDCGLLSENGMKENPSVVHGIIPVMDAQGNVIGCTNCMEPPHGDESDEFEEVEQEESNKQDNCKHANGKDKMIKVDGMHRHVKVCGECNVATKVHESQDESFNCDYCKLITRTKTDYSHFGVEKIYNEYEENSNVFVDLCCKNDDGGILVYDTEKNLLICNECGLEEGFVSSKDEVKQEEQNCQHENSKDAIQIINGEHKHVKACSDCLFSKVVHASKEEENCEYCKLVKKVKAESDNAKPDERAHMYFVTSHINVFLYCKCSYAGMLEYKPEKHALVCELCGIEVKLDSAQEEVKPEETKPEEVKPEQTTKTKLELQKLLAEFNVKQSKINEEFYNYNSTPITEMSEEQIRASMQMKLEEMYQLRIEVRKFVLAMPKDFAEFANDEDILKTAKMLEDNIEETLEDMRNKIMDRYDAESKEFVHDIALDITINASAILGSLIIVGTHNPLAIFEIADNIVDFVEAGRLILETAVDTTALLILNADLDDVIALQAGKLLEELVKTLGSELIQGENFEMVMDVVRDNIKDQATIEIFDRLVSSIIDANIDVATEK